MPETINETVPAEDQKRELQQLREAIELLIFGKALCRENFDKALRFVKTGKT